MNEIIDFEDIKTSDLIKGAIYKGGKANNLSSEPISKILPVGNQSEIRFSGKSESPSVVVLYSTFKDKDWPDSLENDLVVFFGDNKELGKEIHDLPGNRVLRSLFNNYYLSKNNSFPLILLFSKGHSGFDRKFEGVLKPGYKGFQETEDLIAIWKSKEGNRFQNYKATFTLLPVERIDRKTLNQYLISK